MVNTNSGLILGIVELEGMVSQHLRQLVLTAFIVEEQPSQVVKKFGYVDSKVRLLIGTQQKFQAQGFIVQVTLINEEQAKVKINTGKLLTNSGRIQNDRKPMAFNEIEMNEIALNRKELSVHFNNMKIKDLKRSYGKSYNCVMNEKFCLLFKMKVKIGEEIDLIVWTLSLPFLIIANVRQESKAWAVLTWYNTFSEFVSYLVSIIDYTLMNHKFEQGQKTMNSPKEVPFGMLAEVLSQKLKSVVGRGLTEDNKIFLAQKAFRRPDIDNIESLSLSWDLFCCKVLPDHDFTFWEWFYNTTKFLVKYLADMWKDGLIVGFISRSKAENILSNSSPGTFLLRFSGSCKLTKTCAPG